MPESFPKDSMKASSSCAKPSVLMVLTRSLSGKHQAGRLRTLGRIYAVLNEIAEVQTVQVPSLLEEKKYLNFLWLVVTNFLRGRFRLPLQCLLFAHSSQTGRVLEAVRVHSPDVIYLDTIRCAPFAVAIRRVFPDLRIVSDFDDLMSRRCAALRSVGRGFTLGYLARYFPGFIQRMCQSPVISGYILRREEQALRRTETMLASLVDSITLVSSVDARELTSSLPQGVSCEVIDAPPPFAPVRPVLAPVDPLRFIFIGSDGLLQNRMTIEWLVNLWQTKNYRAPLHIYGKQSGSYPLHGSVVFEGYADSLNSVYTRNSILIAPSFISGGVKTKIAEALAHGIITLGNDLAFEGLGIKNNPLVFQNDFLETAPAVIYQHLDSWTEGACYLQSYFSTHFGFESYRAAWLRAVTSDH